MTRLILAALQGDGGVNFQRAARFRGSEGLALQRKLGVRDGSEEEARSLAPRVFLAVSRGPGSASSWRGDRGPHLSRDRWPALPSGDGG